MVQANYRQAENHRVNKFIFIQQIFGQVFALIIGLTGIGCGAWVALNGATWTGGLIASVAITGLAVVFLQGQKDE